MHGPTIDLQRLPERALFDTMVVIMALGDQAKNPHASMCKALWSAMLKSGNKILIAAPTMAEMTRSSRPTTIPNARGVEVVSFDRLAAEALGRQFPFTLLKAKAKETSAQRHYIKYDAMIVACAIRHKARAVVSLDKHVIDMAKKAKLDAQRPDYYKEQDLFSLIQTTP